MRRDALTGLVVTATSLFLFWLTLGLERNPLVPIGPAFYPRIVLGIAALLGLLLFLSGLLSRGKEAPGEKADYRAVIAQFDPYRCPPNEPSSRCSAASAR